MPAPRGRKWKQTKKRIRKIDAMRPACPTWPEMGKNKWKTRDEYKLRPAHCAQHHVVGKEHRLTKKRRAKKCVKASMHNEVGIRKNGRREKNMD